MRKEADRLDCIPDTPPQLLGRHGRDVLAADPDLSGIGRDQPVDHLQGRRFAATGRAQQDA
jgi:hypothetical protein